MYIIISNKVIQKKKNISIKDGIGKSRAFGLSKTTSICGFDC